MQRVDRSELEQVVDEWEALVDRGVGVDAICTRSAWQLAYHDAFAAERPIWLAREDEALVVLAERETSELGIVLEPLENMWGFASPLVGERAALVLGRALCERPTPTLLLGLPLEPGRLEPLVASLAGRFGARALSPTTRYVASLSGGLEAWLDRRSLSFRRNLRAAIRRVTEAGIRFRRIADPAAGELEGLYDQVLDVEARSWKAAAGRGADMEPMRSFYAFMWPRLAARGQLKILLAEQGERIIGYLHGAWVGDDFRGLQFSFDHGLSELGLGNVLQFEMLQWLCESNARSYDLGSYSDYKSRWGEEGLRTFGLLLLPADP